tara:strand:+ start:663 stop:926 length:264 start_codon:yes stop_codon:yes gene_type:complete
MKGVYNMTQNQLMRYRQFLNEQLDNRKVEELFSYVGKLERIAEITAEYREVINDNYSSVSEEDFVLDKLDKAFEEYEIFLNNIGDTK